jgi:hypothetical protein
MKRLGRHSEHPLSIFTLIVIGVEMLAIAAIGWHACTEEVNVRHPATWFGEHIIEPRGPLGQ